MSKVFNYLLLGLLLCLLSTGSYGQLMDNFEQIPPGPPATPQGWSYATGDGEARMKFLQHEGFASVYVDATGDQRNIWWALVKRPVPEVDINQLMRPENELRVEARIRVSHAPRRVNLHFNHQHTTDFHSHLMEYDIPDTLNWHTISMATRDFEVQMGDQINAQMALMDWGQKKYRVDIDYFKVEVVNRNQAGKDLGMQLPYHPPLEDPRVFTHHSGVIQDAMIDRQYPDLNFNDWHSFGDQGNARVITTSGTQMVILRWDLNEFRGKAVTGPALLELTTHSLQRSPAYAKDFGMVRIVEILEGEEDWQQETVTYHSFLAEKPLDEVLNTQMVIDYPVPEKPGEKALFTINPAVLQRLIDGKTKGLAIRALGAVNAAFYAMEASDGSLRAQLHFD